MGVSTCPAAPLPLGTTFERWWRSSGAWVEPANQRRGGESGVQLLQPRDPGRPLLYCKRQSGHTYRSLLHPLGRPTVLRELRAYRAFARLGVRVPRLVYGAARQHEGRWQALLVTEALPGFVSLEQWYAAPARGQDNPPTTAMLEQLAAMLARLHLAGWQHGCCYPKHLFVKVTPQADSAPQIETAMLDLEKSRRRWRNRDASRHDWRQLWRHRGQIPEADLVYLQQVYARALATPSGALQP
ncbi:lipopolysaccharide kinase InaA family protein [Pseudomonas sp. MBLB4123]|uniref:lipopolysaccharide kinase InaA family protein n=1 Tax=Pseudomonas sp. MBLB4123 TaxID=3451557 RepID=UPI003F74EB12